MSGPRSRRLIELKDADRAALELLTRRTTVGVGLVRRARIILLAATGVPLDRIARELREIDAAASRIAVQGARLPQSELDQIDVA